VTQDLQAQNPDLKGIRASEAPTENLVRLAPWAFLDSKDPLGTRGLRASQESRVLTATRVRSDSRDPMVILVRRGRQE